MLKHKKILALLVKLLIGVISFWIIYNRISHIPQFKEQCLQWLQNPHIYTTLIVVVFLMPINWGIESYKWKLITAPIEVISFKTATKSMYTAVCLGNLAPGRAMEFLAKIYFFKKENKPRVTVLHFINGMFQMLITVLVGILAITYKLTQNNQSLTVVYLAITGGLIVSSFFCWCIFNVAFIQRKLSYFKWFKALANAENVAFSRVLILKLLSLSVIRYIVFTSQFLLVYIALSGESQYLQVFASIATYFMLTSIIPMISVIEPAIRAAIALFVFQHSSNDAIIILSSTLIWLTNNVLTSSVGYCIILNQKLQFNASSN